MTQTWLKRRTQTDQVNSPRHCAECTKPNQHFTFVFTLKRTEDLIRFQALFCEYATVRTLKAAFPCLRTTRLSRDPNLEIDFHSKNISSTKGGETSIMQAKIGLNKFTFFKKSRNLLGEMTLSETGDGSNAGYL